MLQTRKSDPNKPVRIMAYGVEGVGKSTLGAKSDKPIFITPEGGVDQLTDSEGNPCEEIPNVESWSRLRESVKQITEMDHNFKTLVLDSADWIEGLCHQAIIGTSGKTITTVNGGYGSGYRQAQNMHQDLVRDLETLRASRGMNIVITAHAHVKPVKDPEMMEDYDSFEIKCHEMVSSIWREWTDGLFFIRFKTFIKPGEDTKKARAVADGSRVLYTVKQPSFQAKNRYGMPPEMEFTENFWNDFMRYAKKGVIEETIEELTTQIQDLKTLLTDEETLKKVDEYFLKAMGNKEALFNMRSRLIKLTGAKS